MRILTSFNVSKISSLRKSKRNFTILSIEGVNTLNIPTIEAFPFNRTDTNKFLLTYNENDTTGGRQMPGLIATVGLLLKELGTFVSYVKNNTFPKTLPLDEE